jgi:hypothetical protein
MNQQQFRNFGSVSLLLLAAMAGPSRLAAQDQPTFKVLYTFSGGTDGNYPISLAGDGKGNFYGMTQLGGDFSCGFGGGCGVVFKVDAKGNETVKRAFTGGADGHCYKLDTRGKETVLYTFCSQPNCADGAFPYPANLVPEEGEGEGEQVASMDSGEPKANEDRGNDAIRSI